MLNCFIEGAETGTVKAAGKRITAIKVFTSKYTQIHTLYLSNNRLTSLQNIDQFKNLSALFLECNRIERIDALYPLRNLPQLTKLNLDLNPVTKLPLFFAHVLRLCPKLENFNNKPVDHILYTTYSRPQLAGFLDLEDCLFDYILMTLPVKRAVHISFATKNVPPQLAMELTDVEDQESIKHALRMKCVGYNMAQYYSYLRYKLTSLNKKIIEYSKGCTKYINQDVINAHIKVLKSVKSITNIDEFMDSLPKLLRSADRFAAEDTDFSESLNGPDNMSDSEISQPTETEGKEYDTTPQDIKDSQQENKKQNQSQQDQNTTATIKDDEEDTGNSQKEQQKKEEIESETSFDEGSSRKYVISARCDPDDNDEASDEEKPNAQRSDGNSEEVTQSCAQTSEGYPTESERHMTVTFSRGNILSHKDGLLFDASQGETMTDMGSMQNLKAYQQNDLSDASDFDAQPRQNEENKRRTAFQIRGQREKIIAFSSEMLASRGESPDEFSTSSRPPPILMTPMESAGSDFEKPNIPESNVIVPRVSSLEKTRNADFDASRGESMDPTSAPFGGNDSDSISAFPQSGRNIVFIRDISFYFRNWKLKFRKRCNPKVTTAQEVRAYAERCETKYQIEKLKNVNESMRRNISQIVNSFEKTCISVSQDRMSRARSITPRTTSINKYLSPSRTYVKSVMGNSSMRKSFLK